MFQNKKSAAIVLVILLLLIGFFLFKKFSQTTTDSSLPADSGSQNQTNTSNTNSQTTLVDSKQVVKDFYNSPKDNSQPINWGNLDKSGKDMQLNGVFSASDSSRTRDTFLNSISQKSFDVFECGKSDHGISMILTPSDSPNSGDRYTKTVAALDRWSPYILKDLAEVLFPNNTITDRDKNQKVVFTPYLKDETHDISYRSATVSIGSVPYAIYYGMVSYNVIITTSKSCLLNASGDLYELVP